MSGYLYICKVDPNQDLYKIGRSEDVFTRIKKYVSGTQLVFCIYVTDVMNKENILIERLRKIVPNGAHKGREYFICKLGVIIREIMVLATNLYLLPNMGTNAITETKGFTCSRCGYATSYKKWLVKHLAEKSCPPTNSDISYKELLAEVNDPGHYCSFCNAVFASRASMYRHKQKCVAEILTKTYSEL